MIIRIIFCVLAILPSACRSQSGQNSPAFITLEEARQKVLYFQKTSYQSPDPSISRILGVIHDLTDTQEKLRKLGVVKESCPEKIDRISQFEERDFQSGKWIQFES